MTAIQTRSLPALSELTDLGGRVAIVTGGAMGIGEGVVRRLHEAGASVVVADLAGDAAHELTTELRDARPGSALAVRGDVADAKAVRELVRAAVDAFGSIDILVNDAGIFPQAPMLD